MSIKQLKYWVGYIIKNEHKEIFVFDPIVQNNACPEKVNLFRVNKNQLEFFDKKEIKKHIHQELNQTSRQDAINRYLSWLEVEGIPFFSTDTSSIIVKPTKESYTDYLHSTIWKEKSEKIKQQRNNICEICHDNLSKILRILSSYQEYEEAIPEVSRFYEKYYERHGSILEVHHRTYARLGNERDEDLAVICFMCHTVITENAWLYGLEEAWNIAEINAKNVYEKFLKMYDGISQLSSYTNFTPYHDHNVDIWLKPPKKKT